jgi:signal transduction histidine kinase
MTLKTKLKVITMVTCASAILLGSIIFVFFEDLQHRNEAFESLSALASAIGHNCQAALKFDIPEDVEKVMESLNAYPSVVFACVVNMENECLSAYHSRDLDKNDILTLDTLEGELQGTKKGFLQVAYPVDLEGEQIGTVYLQSDRRQIHAAVRRDAAVASMIIVIALVLAYVLISRLQHVVTRPILALTDTAKKVSERRDYSIRAKKQSEDELGVLIDTFNDMMSQIENQERKVKELLKTLRVKNKELESIVYVSSHDLRSPLMNIQGYSSELGRSCGQISNLLTKEKLQTPSRQELDFLLGADIPASLEFITTSAKKMDILLAGLLKLSRLGQTTIEIGPLNMNELLSNVLDGISYQIEQGHVNVDVEQLPWCLGDEGQINQVFTNLIDNAIKYSHPDRKCNIRITGSRDEQRSVYCVEDNGLGISPAYKEKVFELFHQLNPKASTVGQGLGLTIVRRIIDRHDGEAWVESESGKGSKFYVVLPSGAAKR